jgi:DNA-directed RNA polymerase specialized sigma24 family protein
MGDRPRERSPAGQPSAPFRTGENRPAIAASWAGEARTLFADEISRAPTPERAAQTAEECRRLLAALGDAELRRIALWKLEGYSNEEIAARMGDGEGRSLPTVERKLARIRRRWQKEITP